MLENYLPILIFLGISTGIGVVLLVLGFLLGRGDKDDEKLSAYECGFEPFEDSRMKFDVRYYLVAILFIIFDLEIAFLFPWAVSLDVVGGFGLIAMGIFLAILVVGIHLRVEKRGAGMGLSTAAAENKVADGPGRRRPEPAAKRLLGWQSR